MKEYTENSAESVDEIFGAEECLRCDRPYTSLRRINGEMRCEHCFDEDTKEAKLNER